MEKVGSNFFAQNKDLKIYPNWRGCAKGYFKVAGMTSCFAWLTCDDLKDIRIERRINHGLGKEVFEADWNGVTVAYVRLRPERLHQGKVQIKKKINVFAKYSYRECFYELKSRTDSFARENRDREFDTAESVALCHPRTGLLPRGNCHNPAVDPQDITSCAIKFRRAVIHPRYYISLTSAHFYVWQESKPLESSWILL